METFCFFMRVFSPTFAHSMGRLLAKYKESSRLLKKATFSPTPPAPRRVLFP